MSANGIRSLLEESSELRAIRSNLTAPVVDHEVLGKAFVGIRHVPGAAIPPDPVHGLKIRVAKKRQDVIVGLTERDIGIPRSFTESALRGILRKDSGCISLCPVAV